MITSVWRGIRNLLVLSSFLVGEARYVPNTQFLSLPFRNELIQAAPKAHAFKDQATNEGHGQFSPVPSARDHLVN